MKIYSNTEDELIELEEISLEINNIEELVMLKFFIEKCIVDIKNNKKFNHEHFSDFFSDRYINELPELIISIVSDA
jgi:hypothetical protein